MRLLTLFIVIFLFTHQSSAEEVCSFGVNEEINEYSEEAKSRQWGYIFHILKSCTKGDIIHYTHRGQGSFYRGVIPEVCDYSKQIIFEEYKTYSWVSCVYTGKILTKWLYKYQDYYENM